MNEQQTMNEQPNLNEQQTMDEQPNLNEQPIMLKREFSVQECVFAWMCVLVGYIVARAFPVNEYPLGMLIASVVAVSSGLFVFYKLRCVEGVLFISLLWKRIKP